MMENGPKVVGYYFCPISLKDTGNQTLHRRKKRKTVFS